MFSRLSDMGLFRTKKDAEYFREKFHKGCDAYVFANEDMFRLWVRLPKGEKRQINLI